MTKPDITEVTRELPPILSIQEAADLLAVNHQVLRREIHKGKLPALKVGGLYRIRRQDLREYLRRDSK